MIRAGTRRATDGLTLIEMLVVVAVIGILSAIVIAGYNAVQGRTSDAAVQSDMASNAKILTEYYAENNKFPTAAQIATLGAKLGFVTSNYDVSNNAALYCYSVDTLKMSLISKSKTGTTYYVTNDNRTPRTFVPAFPQGGAVDCTNSGLPAGSSWLWIHTLGTGWAAWVK